MRIVFSIGHPAQYYFYRTMIRNLKDRHEVHLFIRTKDILEDLVKADGWEYTNLSPGRRSNKKGLIAIALLARTLKLAGAVRRLKPELLVGSDPSISQLAWFFKIPCLNFIDDDYDAVRYYAKLTYPFTTTIVTPRCVRVGKWEAKRLSYDGYMKLAYLHPKQFRPDLSKIKGLEAKSYALIRLVNLDAYHDEGARGVSVDSLERIIRLLEPHGKVFITSEAPLDHRFEAYRLQIPVEDIHHYLCYSRMLVSDSQSMSGEAAMLGTPSVRISSFTGKLSVLDELENDYRLTHAFHPSDVQGYLQKIEDLISMPDLDRIYEERRQTMLSEKIDVTAFATWLIEQYPSSVATMRSQPDVQRTFT